MANRAVVTVGAAALISGSLWMLEPHLEKKDEPWFREQQTQQQVENLADSQEQSDERKRDAANDLVDSEKARRNVPGEHRPRPHVKLRIP